MVKYLLDEGKMYVDMQDDGGGTPLHTAVQSGHVDIARLLLQRNANVVSRNTQAPAIPTHAYMHACMREIDTTRH